MKTVMEMLRDFLIAVLAVILDPVAAFFVALAIYVGWGFYREVYCFHVPEHVSCVKQQPTLKGP